MNFGKTERSKGKTKVKAFFISHSAFSKNGLFGVQLKERPFFVKTFELFWTVTTLYTCYSS